MKPIDPPSYPSDAERIIVEICLPVPGELNIEIEAVC